MRVTAEEINSTLVREVEEVSGQKVSACFQCGKCSGGCPVVLSMDVLPHQVLRYAQLGLVDKLLHCKTLWICASCQTCDSRCPQNVDIPKVIEALRLLVLRNKGGNYLHPHDLSAKVLKNAPQQGLVSAFRKYAK
ncbi:MAG: 4Fe-4S dicluster domain-containing protein [Clostridium sp.]|nr:4Fe-4S dicluster domain-containing protein [Clostridium sp.]